jgi:hypothetical protein
MLVDDTRLETVLVAVFGGSVKDGTESGTSTSAGGLGSDTSSAGFYLCQRGSTGTTIGLRPPVVGDLASAFGSSLVGSAPPLILRFSISFIRAFHSCISSTRPPVSNSLPL